MRADVKSEKTYGMWGAILILVGSFIPVGRFILPLIGLVLVLVSLHGIKVKTGDERPFKNYLYSFIIEIILIVSGIVILFLGFLKSEVETINVYTINESITSFESHQGFSAGSLLIGGVILLFLGLIVSAYFKKKAWESMYEITKVEQFKSAATWYWIGALTLVILVGLILLLVAEIFVILAFSNMPDELELEGESRLDPLWEDFELLV